jgi:GWxTD domain-containing protein
MNCKARFQTVFRPSALTFFVALWFSPVYTQESVAVHSNDYTKWLNDDVRWIITDQERADFKKLSTDEQRDHFVVAFWDRRNPFPGAARNAAKEEHYRRLAYADQHFDQGIPGRRTDRGRFYIMCGPPDEVLRRQAQSKMQPDITQKNGVGTEEWRWTYIKGLGCNVILAFEDKCGSGEFHLSERQDGFRPLRMLGPDCLVNQVLFP